jgi:hypothetical protein
MALADVVFKADKNAAVKVCIRLAAAGAGLDSNHQLQNINDPDNPAILDPEELDNATTCWAVDTAHLATVDGVDHMQLLLTNTSYYPGKVTVYAKATQDDRPLPAGHAGSALPQNDDGEIVLGTLANGEHGFSLIGLKL